LQGKALKVRFITRKWPPAVGGMETYCLRLTQSLSSQVDLEVIALPGQPNGAAPSVPALVGFFLRTLGRLASSSVDVIHIGDMALWPLGWVAKLFNRNCKMVISAHGRDVSLAIEQGTKAKAYQAYLQVGARLLGSARVIANSAYIRELARRMGFQPVAVVPLGTDFGPTDSVSRNDLIFAGRVTRSKGLRFLVEEVIPLLPDVVRLRVAGPLWEESEEPLLAHSRVDYLGALDEQQLANEFSRARAVLVPSRTSEGFGLIAIEAAACGAFVVASDHSGLSEVVSPSIGALVDANDPQEWASAIREALEMSDNAYRAHGARAREIVDACYRWPKVAEATLAIYRAR
jgi:glycosyltransferase involved in cell wall biosynthesis